MILCYEGTPGSGKTYDAVNKVIQNLRLGRVVYSNIEGFDLPECREHIKLKTGLDDYELSKNLIYLRNNEMLKVHEVAKHGSLLVYDEVHKLFSNREWQTGTNKAFAEWASTHRHGGYDVVLITQNLEKVDSHVRGLVEFTYRYKKNNYFGKLFENRYFCYAYSEDSTKVIGRRQGKYNSSIFPCYNSYSGKDIKELGVQSNVNILKHPVFYAIPVLLIIFAYMFTKSSFASGDLFGTTARLQKKEVSQKSSSQQGSFVRVFEGPVQLAGQTKISQSKSFPSQYIPPVQKSENYKPSQVSQIKNPYSKPLYSSMPLQTPLGSNVPFIPSNSVGQGVTVNNSVASVISGFGSSGDKVVVLVQGGKVVDMDGYSFTGDKICKSSACLSIGDRI